MQIVYVAAYSPAWRPENAREIVHMRHRLEDSVPPGDLKRGPGGIVDVEFVTQLLQLKYARERHSLRKPSTRDALQALHEQKILGDDDFTALSGNYRLLRRFESRLRLMDSAARDQLPDDPQDQQKLARLLGLTSADRLWSEFTRVTTDNRKRFDRLTGP
jgi:glutamate-ammonia-ligase adenylyltransferase